MTDPGAAPPAGRWGVQRVGAGLSIGLWAPSAMQVALVTAAGRRIPLAPSGGGWHEAACDDLPPGTLYRFVVDGAAVPDPASRCQPGGPEGWSEITDPAGYAWHDAEWQGRPWHETVLYELHLGTFSAAGTFLGAIPHLDHLVALGVTTIELMPVATFPGARNWGYDGVLPYAPDCSYGRPDDLKRLVDECHRRGLAVVLDVVYNHFGPAANALPDYAPGFFTDRHKTPWGPAIDFDGPASAAVREFFIQNAVYWIIEFHMDGLRLDAVQAVYDSSDDPILAVIARRVRAAAGGRAIGLMLENDDNVSRWMARPATGGALQYDAQWNDDFHHVMRVLVAGRRDGYYSDYAVDPLRRLGRALAEGFSYQGEASTHRPGLIRGTPSAQLPPTAFVNFLQNHDQVGNTPFGLRLTALAPAAAVRCGTAVLLLSPGIPMLFMGQEWGSGRPFDYFCDYPEPLASLVRTGRREESRHLPEFSDPAALERLADPIAATTRDGSVLDWDAVTARDHADWLAFHRRLLDIRRGCIVPLLPLIDGNAGSFRVLHARSDGAGALEATWRLRDGRCLALAVNLSDDLVETTAPAGEILFQLSGDAPTGALAAWDLWVRLLNPA